MRAFEVNAFDYLLKPIKASGWCRARQGARGARRGKRPTDRTTASIAERVFLRDGDRCWIVHLAEIAMFEVEGTTRGVFGANRPSSVRRSTLKPGWIRRSFSGRAGST